MTKLRSVFPLTLALAFLLLLPVSSLAKEKENDNAIVGPAKVTMGDNVATIDLPEGYAFIKQDVAQKILEEQGNPHEGVLGMLIPKPKGEDESVEFFVVCKFQDMGYVKDDDAEKIDAKELLESYREGTREQNKELEARGIPPVYIAGWAEEPHYDRTVHHVIWGISARDEDCENSPVTLVNYNTRILGRKGVLSMNLVTGPDTLNEDKRQVNELLKKTSFVAGNRYEDFKPGVDKESGLGLTGLILGGGALAVAAKTGLLGALSKWLIAAVLICKKFIIVIILAAVAGVKALFGGGKKSDYE